VEGSAGIYRAKEAVGYYKLHRAALYGAARDEAIQALSTAIGIAQQIGVTSNPIFVEALNVTRAADFPRQALNSNVFNVPLNGRFRDRDLGGNAWALHT
jgi:hypothetical protein